MVPSSSSHKTKVYNPKTFFLHAALLGQAFAHCPIFPTAASRRSLDRISVPMWPFNLSVRLPIVDLVSRYLTNYLIGYEPILQRIPPLMRCPCELRTSCGISSRFQLLSPSEGQVAHTLLTRPPLSAKKQALSHSVQLACVRHAASVYPEPGSNSLKKNISPLGPALPPASEPSVLPNRFSLSVTWIAAGPPAPIPLSSSRSTPQLSLLFLINRVVSLFNFQGPFDTSNYKNIAAKTAEAVF